MFTRTLVVYSLGMMFAYFMNSPSKRRVYIFVFSDIIKQLFLFMTSLISAFSSSPNILMQSFNVLAGMTALTASFENLGCLRIANMNEFVPTTFK